MMRLALILALLPLAADAECLTATSIDRGVVFQRQSGDKGLAIRKGGVVEVDYVTNRPGIQDERIARFGIYESKTADYPFGPDMIGVGTIETETTYARKGPEPEPGLSYRTTWRAKISDYMPVENSPIVTRAKGSVTFLFQEVKEVKLSGCTYRAMGVEATFQTEGGWKKQRWIYFPDLGFALETRVTTPGGDRKLGLVEMRAPT
jgi:hypothetical protein